jgi:hypothetical protein
MAHIVIRCYRDKHILHAVSVDEEKKGAYEDAKRN